MYEQCGMEGRLVLKNKERIRMEDGHCTHGVHVKIQTTKKRLTFM